MIMEGVFPSVIFNSSMFSNNGNVKIFLTSRITIYRIEKILRNSFKKLKKERGMKKIRINKEDDFFMLT